MTVFHQMQAEANQVIGKQGFCLAAITCLLVLVL
jgi:hypothetical protein